jgi:pre-rRNA-processing protein TSR2
VRDLLGGPASSDKRDWLCGAVVDLYPPFTAASLAATAATAGSEHDNEYVQEFLAAVMEDEFDMVIDVGDPGLWQVAEQIVRVRRDCAAGVFANVELLGRRFAEKGGKVDAVKLEGGSEDEDEDDEDDEGEDDGDDGDDVDMDEAPPLVKAPRQKVEPEVDEDGFTKVTKRKR